MKSRSRSSWANVYRLWSLDRSGGQVTVTADRMRWSCVARRELRLRKVCALSPLIVRSDAWVDDLIRLHKSMVETNSDVNSALSKALAEANAQLLEQRDFAVAIDSFQKQLLLDLEASGAEAQSFFQKLMDSMNIAAQNLLSQFSRVTKEAEMAVAELSEVSSV